MIRLITNIIYFTILLILAITSVLALRDGCYIIGGAVIGIVGVASILTSLIPYFISQSFFKKYLANPMEKKHLKIWGLVIYLFCFPVKLCVIYMNLVMLDEGCHWAFG